MEMRPSEVHERGGGERMRRRLRRKTQVEPRRVERVDSVDPPVAPEGRAEGACGVGQDPCFASGDPDEAALWAAIDEDLRMEAIRDLELRERATHAKEIMLDSLEERLELRAAELEAKEREMQRNASERRRFSCACGRCERGACEAVARLLSR